MTKTVSKKKSKRRAVAHRATSPRFILLGLSARWSNKLLAKENFVVCNSLTQMSEVARRANKDSLWIVSRSEMIDQLIRAMGEFVLARSARETRLGNLLMLDAPRTRTLAVLPRFFESVVGTDSSFKFLPPDQLAEVLSAPKERSRDLFIGGLVDTKSRVLALVRGDLSRVVVPLSIFRAAGTSKPDFARFEVDDYGQTIRFGSYEAGADFVLYALDPEFRRRINAKRREEKEGFGPSLRRLRAIRKIGRDEFDGIAAKTIARIERGEIQRPRGATLQVISKVLGVEAKEIETY